MLETDILNTILNDVLNNDINSIKKISLINRYWRKYLSNLSKTDVIEDKLDIINKYINSPNHGMYEAAKKGHMDIVKLMIEKGATLRNAGLRGAAKGGHIDVVKYLIEKGANDLNNGLFYAAKGGHIDIVEFLQNKIKENV